MLCDFGVACMTANPAGDHYESTVGTPYWMAPEVCACDFPGGYTYNDRVDVWSFGVMLFELLLGRTPQQGVGAAKAIMAIPASEAPVLPAKGGWSDLLRDFVHRCVIKDPAERPSAADLLKHPFLRGADIEAGRAALVASPHFGRAADNDARGLAHEVQKMRRRESVGLLMASAAGEDADLTAVAQLTEGTLLAKLRSRYQRRHLYTSIGDILIALNPFQELPIYGPDYAAAYAVGKPTRAAPHIFGVAQAAFVAMGVQGESQVCVISGESGSGKTETSKYFLRHLLDLSRNENDGLVFEYDAIHFLVNGLTEAFGNAATQANHNSSRFGKYVSLRFDDQNHVLDARMAHYVLEKSRVAAQAEGERNFHIFYQLLEGLDQATCQQLALVRDPTQYAYLRSAGKLMPAPAVAKREYDVLFQQMQDAGFGGPELDGVISVLAVVLHLGNLDFAPRRSDKPAAGGNQFFDLEVTGPLQIVSAVLGCQGVDLGNSLVTSLIVMRGETIVLRNSVEAARDARDAMAKAIYARVFGWLVNKVNTLLSRPRARGGRAFERAIGVLDIFGFENLRSNSLEQLCINVANERLQTFFNERVFAWQARELEAEGVDAREVSYRDNTATVRLFLGPPVGLFALLDEECRFPAASDLSLVTKLHAHLGGAAEYSAPRDERELSFAVQHFAGVVRYSVAGWLEKNKDTLSPSSTSLLRDCSLPMLSALFSTAQTATGGLAVEKQAQLKNRQSNARQLIRALRGSVWKQSGRPAAGQGGKRGGSRGLRRIESLPDIEVSKTQRSSLDKNTVSSHFRASLADLVAKLSMSYPHFVRCVRPNRSGAAFTFDDAATLEQLRNTGVMETVRIRREGFSDRLDFATFVARYKPLAFPLMAEVPPHAQSCVHILTKVGAPTDGWRVGRTKVFLRTSAIDVLLDHLDRVQRSGRHIINLMRIFLAKRIVLRREEELHERRRVAQELEQAAAAAAEAERAVAENAAAIKIQAAFKGHKGRQSYLMRVMEEAAATAIQTRFRGYRARVDYREARAARTIQAGYRGHQGRQYYGRLKQEMRENEAAIKIQSGYRGLQGRRDFKARKKAEAERKLKGKPQIGFISSYEDHMRVQSIMGRRKREEGSGDRAEWKALGNGQELPRQDSGSAAPAPRAARRGSGDAGGVRRGSFGSSRSYDLSAGAAAAPSGLKRGGSSRRSVAKTEPVPIDAGIVPYAPPQGRRRTAAFFENWLPEKLKPLPLEDDFWDADECLVEPVDVPEGAMPLNRYKNILPNPRTRVPLQLPAYVNGADPADANPATFINANFVNSVGDVRYIATQGPKEETYDHFWRMVWEHNSQLIVMATGLEEGGRIKCSRYWPEEPGDAHAVMYEPSMIQVTVCSVNHEGSNIVTGLELKWHGKRRTVVHVQFTGWPDQGVPTRTRDLLLMAARLFDYGNQPDVGPAVVHCSAGVGRTGVVVAVDIGLRTLRAGRDFDVFSAVKDMRRARCCMVQTYEQLELVHRMVARCSRRPHFLEARLGPGAQLIPAQRGRMTMHAGRDYLAEPVRAAPPEAEYEEVKSTPPMRRRSVSGATGTSDAPPTPPVRRRPASASALEETNEVLEKSIARADKLPVKPNYVHPSQVVVDEGDDAALPRWRQQQRQSMVLEEDEAYASEQSRRADRYFQKKQREIEARNRGESLLREVDEMPTPPRPAAVSRVDQGTGAARPGLGQDPAPAQGGGLFGVSLRRTGVAHAPGSGRASPAAVRQRRGSALARENEAAAKIQAGFRGHRTRREIKAARAAAQADAGAAYEEQHARELRGLQDEEQRQAAIRIQAGYRGHQARRRSAELRAERAASDRASASPPRQNALMRGKSGKRRSQKRTSVASPGTENRKQQRNRNRRSMLQSFKGALGFGSSPPKVAQTPEIEEESEGDDELAELDDPETAAFFAALDGNRLQRRQQESIRRRQLRDETARQQAEAEAKLAAELAVIEAKASEEERAKEAEKAAIVEEAQARLGELTFDFNFG